MNITNHNDDGRDNHVSLEDAILMDQLNQSKLSNLLNTSEFHEPLSSRRDKH